MPSNYTENYQLSQWEAGDKVQRTDFNSDNAKIDAALAAQQEALAKRGNCSIGVFTYQGTGTATSPTQITFPQMPAFFIVAGSNILMGKGGITPLTMSYNVGGYGHTNLVDVSWSGNTLSISCYGEPDRQLNANKLYTVIGFYIAE